MANSLRVVWINGMNIDRVHFEQMERYLERNINQKTIDINDNYYGVYDLEFSHEMLGQGKIGLNRLSGIGPDGCVFNAPQEDLLPEPLEIKPDTLANSVIVLKIPMSVETIADISVQNSLPGTKFIATQSLISSRTFDDTNANLLGQLEDNQLNSAYSQEKINLILGSVRLTLGFAGSKSSGEIEIPICRIKSIDLNKNIILDDKFIPTSLNVARMILVITYLEEIIHATKQHRDSLSEAFVGISKTKTTLDFSTLSALNVLKKWHLLFCLLKNKNKLHPEILYEKLVEFQADLLSLDFGDDNSDFIRYDHDNITQSVIPLMNNTKFLFSRIVSPKYLTANVTTLGNGFFLFSFDNVSVLQDSAIFFAVGSDNGTEYLQNNFRTQSKLSSQSKIKHIVASQLKGLNMEQLAIVPSMLPHLNGYVYYKIDKTDDNWKDLKGESSLAVYITNQIANPDIRLWAIYE